VEELEADIVQLKSTVNTLMATLKAQAAQIQEVDAQLEADKARSRIAADHSTPGINWEFVQSF
jgi:hypothetical protein